MALVVAGVEIRHLRYAVAIADCGSFSRAAAMLGLETSAVSRAMRELENLLGVSLFERHTRGVSLTCAGAEYLVAARDILARLDRARERALEAGAGKHGQITIGHVWSFARGAAASLLASYRAENPNVVLHLVEDGPEALLARMGRFELDLLLTATPAPERLILGGLSDVNIVPLWAERLYAVVPGAETRPSLTWGELAAHQLLYRRADAAPAFARYIEEIGGPTLKFEAQDCSHDGLIALVAAGAGWTLLPESLASSRLASLRFVPITSNGAEFQVVLVWQRRTDNPALNRFVALARRLHGSPPAK
jgi:DNA-binding transcriptional LysR family regulator